MSRLSNIRSKASNIKNSVTGRTSRDGGDELGPDRGTMDQLEARKERAKIEARREAQREQREQELEEARQEARQEVQDSSGGGIISRATSALSAVADEVDIDGDGRPLADELADDDTGTFAGSSSQGSGGVPTAFEEDLAALEGEVDENDREINRLEDEVFGNGDGDNTVNDPLGVGFDPAAQLGYDDDDGGGF